MKKCALSIIIPIYNSFSFIEKTVKNIIKIEKIDYELILVDDGSTDQSLKLCYRLKDKYKNKNIRVFSKKNGGVSSARNYGLEKATGKYIYFMDSDDEIDVIKFEKAFKNCLINNYCLYIFGMNFVYLKDGKQKFVTKKTVDNSLFLDKEEVGGFFWNLYDKNYLSSVWNKFFMKKIIDDNKLKFNYEMKVYEDLSFSLNFISYSNNIYIDHENIYNYFIDVDYKVYKKRKFDGIEKNIEILENGLEKFFNDMNLNNSYSINRKKIFYIYLWYLSILIKVSNHSKDNYLYLKKVVNLLIGRKYLENIYSKKINDKILFFLIRNKLYLLLYFYIKIKVMVN